MFIASSYERKNTLMTSLDIRKFDFPSTQKLREEASALQSLSLLELFRDAIPRALQLKYHCFLFAKYPSHPNLQNMTSEQCVAFAQYGAVLVQQVQTKLRDATKDDRTELSKYADNPAFLSIETDAQRFEWKTLSPLVFDAIARIDGNSTLQNALNKYATQIANAKQVADLSALFRRQPEIRTYLYANDSFLLQELWKKLAKRETLSNSEMEQWYKFAKDNSLRNIEYDISGELYNRQRARQNTENSENQLASTLEAAKNKEQPKKPIVILGLNFSKMSTGQIVLFCLIAFFILAFLITLIIFIIVVVTRNSKQKRRTNAGTATLFDKSLSQ